MAPARIENIEKWNAFAIENKIELDKWRQYLDGSSWAPVIWVDKTKQYKLLMTVEEWENRNIT